LYVDGGWAQGDEFSAIEQAVIRDAARNYRKVLH
jgi:hypothetical protein